MRASFTQQSSSYKIKLHLCTIIGAFIGSDYPLQLRRVREALRDEPHRGDVGRLFAGLGGPENDLVRRHLPRRVLVGREGLQLRPLVHAEHLESLDDRQF